MLVLPEAWRRPDCLPTGALNVRILDTAHVSEYAFGTQTAVFHICSRCGAVPVVTCDIAGNTYGNTEQVPFISVE